MTRQIRHKDVRERFIQEARIQAVLDHPNIVRVLNAVTEGPELAVFMEYVDGLSLDRVIEKRGALPIEDALHIMLQVLAGVGLGHSKGIIHRDLKPSNVMVRGDGSVKVTDFGKANIVGSNMTQTGTAMGTVHYMSPEQILGAKDVDGRSDIYSLGCLFFEMLSGLPPYLKEGGDGTDSDFAIKLSHILSN